MAVWESQNILYNPDVGKSEQHGGSSGRHVTNTEDSKC